MQQRRMTFNLNGKTSSLPVRALIFILVFNLSVPLHAVNMGRLKGLQGFQATALAVAFINKAMREASENPMDAWRRQNVAHAVGMLPIALRALATEFQKGELHDGDLKFVTGILGGFVDMSAPDKFQKFMKNPEDKSLIPQLGSNFPQEILKKADEQGFPAQSKSIVFNESAKGNEAALPMNPSASVSVASQELANLNEVFAKSSSPSGKSGKESASKGTPSKSVVFNENAPKNPSGYSVPSGSGGVASGTEGTANFEANIARDIANVESSLGLNRPAQNFKGATVIQVDNGVEKSSLDENFFNGKKVEKKEVTKSAAGRALASDPKEYSLKVKPKYWKVVPLLMLLVGDVRSEATPAAAPAPQGNGQGSGCQSGKCGGGGGQGEGGGGGQGGADFLFGLAAIMAAAAPMVAASIQADADKKIAKINADTQVQLSNIAAENSKYQADSTERMANQQSKMAQDINKQNNDQQTQRLQMQLSEVAASREQAKQSEIARREEERALNQERIALAQRQADDQLKLAQASFNAQLTQAGLSTGFSNVNRPGGNLTVDTAQTGNRAPTYTNTSTGLGNSFGNSSFTGPTLASNTTTGGMTAQGVTRGIASTKLLTSAKNSKSLEEEEEEENIDPKTKKKTTKKKTSSTVSVRGVRSTYKGAYQVSTRTTTQTSGTLAYPDSAIGSTRGFKSVIPTTTEEKTKTDLASFADQATSSNRGFAAWKSSQTPTVGEEVQRARGVTGPSHSGAYNAPDMGSTSTGSRGAVRGVYGGGSSSDN